MPQKINFDQKLPLAWKNIIFLVLTPLATFIALPFYLYHHGVTWLEIVVFFVFYYASGIGITMGYHRLFAHRTYEAHPIIKIPLLIFGALAFENSALKWASDHRHHHLHVDTHSDPYNAKRGFWHSHIGWVLHKEPDGRVYDNVSDLLEDKWVMWQDRYDKWLAAIVGWGIPLLIGFIVGRPFGFFLWGALLRTVFVHHGTFFINSLAHICGHQTYDDRTTARDSWWLALFTFGEGFHNFHHRFQSDFRNGVRWYHWDPSKWLISLLSYLKLTWNLRRSPDHVILANRWEMDLKRLESKLASRSLSQDRWLVIRTDLENTLANLEVTFKAWKESLSQYAQSKRQLSAQAAEEFRQAIETRKRIFREALDRWEAQLNFYSQSVPQIA